MTAEIDGNHLPRFYCCQTWPELSIRPTIIQQAQFFVGNYFAIQGDKEKSKKYMDKAMNGENKLFVMQMIVKMIFYELKGELEIK